jgi:hypothetical protein
MFRIEDLSKNLIEVMDDELVSIVGGYTQAELNRISGQINSSIPPAPTPTPYILPILPSSSPTFGDALRSTTIVFGDSSGNTGSFGPGGFSFRNPSGTGVSFGPGGFGGSVGFKF